MRVPAELRLIFAGRRSDRTGRQAHHISVAAAVPPNLLLHLATKETPGEVPYVPRQELIDRARMFDERADRAVDPISRRHYREMAAHYRSLSVEFQE